MAEDSINLVERITDALATVRSFAERAPSSAEVIAAWAPVMGALQRLGFSLFQVANHLVAVSQDDDVELMPAALAEELRGDLDALREAFPGVDHVLFGVDSLDDLIDSAVGDEGVRFAFATAGRALAKRFDALVEKLVAIAMDPDSAGFTSEQMSGYLLGVERVLSKILDRWLAEATGTG